MHTIGRRTAITAAAVITGTTGALGLAAVAPATAAPAPAAPAAAVRGCVAADLAVSLGRLDAGAGQRYQDVRIANVGDHDCRLTGYPRFRFEAAGQRIGFASQHQGMAAERVVLEVGDSAWSTLWYTDPGPVPVDECGATTATSVLVKLPHRPHRFEVALSASVCTSRGFRPTAYPVRDRKVF